MQALVLAVTADNAAAILDGRRKTEQRTRPPKRLPARAHLAVVGTGTVVGECEIGEPVRQGAKGWAMPVRNPRRYPAAKPITAFGLERIPRSFRYV